MPKLPISVLHYSRHDPRAKVGGVETFARNLANVFESVEFMTPESLDVERAEREQWLVICDNHFVTDWPDSIPVIGFQHGVAAVKCKITKKRSDRIIARRQAKAAKRPNTLWVACAKWVGNTFASLHGNGASHVVYYQVDVDRFDGQRSNVNERLILHDARLIHKGKRLVSHLRRKFPAWKFEPLDCRPEDVPDRMRSARAFLHLSRYEGNSVVCNEAMAMDLPCMFTSVGLLNDPGCPDDIFQIDPDLVFGNTAALDSGFEEFVRSLESRTYHPRKWILAHAATEVHQAAWRRVTEDFATISGWRIGSEPKL